MAEPGDGPFGMFNAGKCLKNPKGTETQPTEQLGPENLKSELTSIPSRGLLERLKV